MLFFAIVTYSNLKQMSYRPTLHSQKSFTKRLRKLRDLVELFYIFKSGLSNSAKYYKMGLKQTLLTGMLDNNQVMLRN